MPVRGDSYNIDGHMSISIPRNVTKENKANMEERKCRYAEILIGIRIQASKTTAAAMQDAGR